MIYKSYYLNGRLVDKNDILKHHKLADKKQITINKKLDKPNTVNEYYYE